MESCLPRLLVGLEVQALQRFAAHLEYSIERCRKRDKMDAVTITEVPLQIRDIETTTLPNGVRVISERMQHVRSVSLGVWIRKGSRSESARENGISHFI